MDGLLVGGQAATVVYQFTMVSFVFVFLECKGVVFSFLGFCLHPVCAL